MSVSVHGLPIRTLADEPFTFAVSGLAPDIEVSLDVRLDNHLGQQWRGSFTARADSEGVLDLAATALVGFDEPDPTALLWALEPQGDCDQAPNAQDATGTVIIRHGQQILGSHEFSRAFTGEGVTCLDVHDPVSGALYIPAGPGPHPAVVTVSGSGGGIARHEAALLASHGFACLTVAYFNYPGRPAELFEQPLEYFGAAFDWLAAQAGIRPQALTVMGRSRGGELSLLLGATFSAVGAVIAIVPSGYIWGSVRSNGNDGSAWTCNGVPLPAVKSTPGDQQQAVTIDGAIHLTPSFRAAIANAPKAELAAAAIAAERINGPILMLCGAADALWDSTELSDVVLERTTRAAFAHEVQRQVYPDAGHSISVPYLPVLTSSVHQVSAVRLAYGGSRAGTAHARVLAWAAVLDFLAARGA